MIYNKSLYPAVARRMRAALRASGYESEAAAVDQCLRTSIFQAIAVGWKLLYVHDLQYFMSFEEELLSFGCLSQTQDETLYQAARHMLEDYMDKNGDRVDEFLGGYDVGCSLAMTEPNDLLRTNGSSYVMRPSPRGFDPRKKNGEQGTQTSEQGSGKRQAYSPSPGKMDPRATGEHASGVHAPGENEVPDPSSWPSSSSSSSSASAASTVSAGSSASAVSGPGPATWSGSPSVRPLSHNLESLQSTVGGVTDGAHDPSVVGSGGGGKKTRRGQDAQDAGDESRNTTATGKRRRTLNTDAVPPVGTLLTYRQDLQRSLRRFVADDKTRLRQRNILHQMDTTRQENHAGRTEGPDAVPGH